MKISSENLETPEQVAAWLGGPGTGMPPPYEGTGQALRMEATDNELAVRGALYALEHGTAQAKAQALRSLVSQGHPLVRATIEQILERQPAWWTEPDAAGHGTLGDKFLDVAAGLVARDLILGPKLLALAKNSPAEDEVMWAVLAWRKEGPAFDLLLERLNSGQTWPADSWPRVVSRYTASPTKLQELITAIKLKHGPEVKIAIISALPAASEYWK